MLDPCWDALAILRSNISIRTLYSFLYFFIRFCIYICLIVYIHTWAQWFLKLAHLRNWLQVTIFLQSLWGLTNTHTPCQAYLDAYYYLLLTIRAVFCQCVYIYTFMYCCPYTYMHSLWLCVLLYIHINAFLATLREILASAAFPGLQHSMATLSPTRGVLSAWWHICFYCQELLVCSINFITYMSANGSS